MHIYDEIGRRLKAGVDDLKSDVEWRIAALSEIARGPVDLADLPNRHAFDDVLNAYVPPGYGLVLVESDLRPCQASRAEGGTISFGGYLTTDGSAVAEIERTIILGRRLAQHHNFRVAPRYRRNGIASRSLLGSIALYDRLGVRHVVLRAAFAGTWFWAQWGFHFARQDECDRLVEHAQLFVDRFGGGLDVSHFTHPQQLLRLGDETEITFHDVCDAFPERRTNYEQFVHDHGIGMHDPIPFGRVVLMTGISWDGVLDLEHGTADRLIFDDFASKIRHDG